MIDVILCHRSRFLTIADTVGYLCGCRADILSQTNNFRENGGSIEFIDNNFKDVDQERLIEAVTTVEPKYAVLPDMFDVSEFGSICEVAETFESVGTKPIFVPKDTMDWERVPDSWRIGYSVSSDYGGTEIDISTFTDHEVHLLGGSALQQFSVADEAVENGVTLASADGGFYRCADYGRILNEPAQFLNGGNSTQGHEDYETISEEYDWDGRMAVSIIYYYEMWRQWCRDNSHLTVE